MKPFALALGLGVLLLGSASCSSEEEARDKPQGDRCALNSECVEPMVCGFERCRPQCATSRDCGGRRCMRSTATANVCQLDDESTCSHNSECPGSQICASDRQCRDACVTAKDCVSGQECIDSVCVEPAELQPDGTLTSRAPADGVACTYATECPGTLVCLDGVCAIECLEDKDCFVTWACFKESVGGDGRCYPRSALPDGSAPGPGTDGGDADGGDAGTTASELLSVDASCQVQPSGTVKCWDYRALQASADAPPELVPTLDTVTRVVGTPDVRYALRGDGTVHFFGANVRMPTASYQTLPAPVPGLSGVTRVTPYFEDRLLAETPLGTFLFTPGTATAKPASPDQIGIARVFGRHHALLASGDVRAFEPTGTSVKGLTGVVDVASFAYVEAGQGRARESACAVLANGALTCWGGIPEGADLGGIFLGGAIATYDQPTPQVVTEVPNAVQVSSNGIRVCARRQNGEVSCWCAQENGEICNVTVPSVQNDPQGGTVLARALARHVEPDQDSPMCIVRLDGTVGCARYADFFVTVPGLAGAVEVVVATRRVYARMPDGRLLVWNSDDDVVTDIPL